MEQQTKPIKSVYIGEKKENNSSGILLTTGILCVNKRSSQHQNQQWITDGCCQSQNANKTVLYNKQEDSMEDDKKQKQQLHGCPPITQSKLSNSEINNKLKETLTNAACSGYSNRKLISYTTSTIKPLKANLRNRKEAENTYKSLIGDSPPDSDNEYYNKDRMRNVDKQLNVTDNNYEFISLLSSDDESVKEFTKEADTNIDSSPLCSIRSDVFSDELLTRCDELSDEIGGSPFCTNGNFSPLSSIGSSDFSSNKNLNNITKPSSKQLKRRFLENLDIFTPEGSDCEVSPVKFRRQDETNKISSDGKAGSSDELLPSFHNDTSEPIDVEILSSDEEYRTLDISPQYDHNMKEMKNVGHEKLSHHTSTMITDSPPSSFSEESGNDFLISSPTRPDTENEVNNSPLYDDNSQFSDNSDCFFSDMFDD